MPGDAMLNPAIKLYDAVRIEELYKAADLSDSDIRQPRVGDVAWIIEIYENPPGYELECSDKDGTTEWLQGFRAEEIKLEKLVKA
jgi:hypothetical protein